MSKILITGGHLTPALAFIDYCHHHKLDFEFVFVGRELAQAKDKQPAWEKTEIETRKIKFINFAAAKTGDFDWRTFRRSLKIAKNILIAEKVDLVLSFGGYLALPFAFAAAPLKIPVITHEQTRVLGKANRAIGLVARAIAVSFPETTFWQRQKVVVTGNPLRQAIFAEQKSPPTWFKSANEKKLPWLYIAGGSQGAQAINQVILPILPWLTKKFIVIHQVGRASATRQPLKEIQNYLKHPANKAAINLQHYYPREFLSADELSYFYPRFSLAISRAGANTVGELSAFAIPTLYIPLPFANYHEQEKNAARLVEKRMALMLKQENLQASNLMFAIQNLTTQMLTMRQNLEAQASDHDEAAAKLAQLVRQNLLRL